MDKLEGELSVHPNPVLCASSIALLTDRFGDMTSAAASKTKRGAFDQWRRSISPSRVPFLFSCLGDDKVNNDLVLNHVAHNQAAELLPLIPASDGSAKAWSMSIVSSISFLVLF